jgi:hypothetical protein
MGLENISFRSGNTTRSTKNYNQQTDLQEGKREITLNDMPNEVMAIIWSYLTFTEKTRIGCTNNRMRALSEMPEFWRLIRIPHQVLTYNLISNIITMGTKRLSIPWCAIKGNWSGYTDLENILTEGLSDLEYLDMTGCNGSGTYDGNDRMAAILVSRSEDLTILDLTSSRLTLVSTIMRALTWECGITALNLSTMGDNTHPWGDHQNLQFETIQIMVDKCHLLTDLIMSITNLCRTSINYLCDHLTNNILRLNLSKERILDENIRALSRQCPKLQYLNICETMVSYDVFSDIALTWKTTMVYMCLPHQMAVTLALDSNTVVAFDGLENLTNLWENKQISAPKSPELAMLVQFKSMIDSMPILEFLHMGDWNDQMPYDFLGTQQHTTVLMRMFPNLTINLSPFALRSPVEVDPYFRFCHIESRKRTNNQMSKNERQPQPVQSA